MSSVSWGSTSWARQTRRTIGPWRSTRASKASSAAFPRLVENRSSSCPSVSSRIAPTLKSVLNCRRTAPSFRVFTSLFLGPREHPFDASNVTRYTPGCNSLKKNDGRDGDPRPLSSSTDDMNQDRVLDELGRAVAEVTPQVPGSGNTLHNYGRDRALKKPHGCMVSRTSSACSGLGYEGVFRCVHRPRSAAILQECAAPTRTSTGRKAGGAGDEG